VIEWSPVQGVSLPHDPEQDEAGTQNEAMAGEHLALDHSLYKSVTKD